MSTKILIVSDSHGKMDNLRKAIGNMAGTMDRMIHLGDSLCSLETMEELAGCPVDMVRGNSDGFTCSLPLSKLVKIGDYTAFLTHGHRYDCKWSLGPMKEAARENGAGIVMFGHTHMPLLEPYGDVVVLNPGSISQPRQEGHRPTYMVMTVADDGRADYVLVHL